MQTKRGIELNLKESSYCFNFLGLNFFFSSEFYLEKFKNTVKEYVELESLKICNRYKIPIAINRYLAISYYKKIEKRGFRIIDGAIGKEIERVFFTSNLIKEE